MPALQMTVALLILIFVVMAVYYFFPQTRESQLWKLVYFILAVITLLWLLAVTGLWTAPPLRR